MKKTYKKVLIAVLFMLLFLAIVNTNKCFAISDVTDDFFWESWEPTVEEDEGLLNKIEPIIGAIRIIGMIVSVGTLAVIGIKIMLGSVEEKANYKQVLKPWLIGATMVFAITMVPTIIYDLTLSTLSESVHTDGTFLEGYDDAIKWASTLENQSDYISVIKERSSRIDVKTFYENEYWEGYGYALAYIDRIGI